MKTKINTQLNRIFGRTALSLSLMALLTGVTLAGASTQSDDETYSRRVRDEVRDDPNGTQDDLRGDSTKSTREDGPVRLARFRYLKGGVSYRTDAQDAWTDAGVNTPLREGAQISVSDDDSRAELQFDDGSILRLGRGALVTLTSLYSDTEGAFTQVRLQEGTASLHLKHNRSVYQVDTPYCTVKAAGPASFRVDAGEDVEVSVNSGKALIESSQGEKNLVSGDFLRLSDPEDDLVIRDQPRPDSWDKWNTDRDQQMTEGERVAKRHLPSNIAIVATDLNGYGDWRDDSEYGSVWIPRVTAVDWRPYNDGRWSWVAPFGWTWVSNEAWGWAPYHYGSWVHRSWGWGWVPGPVTQCWSPGVVQFCETGSGVAWVPLAPTEIVYPTTLAIGSRFNNWSLYFSIGQAGVYYYNNSHFYSRPWHSGYVNRSTTIINNTTIVNNYNQANQYNESNYNYRNNRARSSFDFANNNTVVTSSNYVPLNARLAAGASVARLNEFGRGGYRTVTRAEGSVFGQGRAVGAPRAGSLPASGPAALRPDSVGTPLPSRNQVLPSARSMERRTYAPTRSVERSTVPQQPPTTAERLQGRTTLPATRARRQDPSVSAPQIGRPGVYPGAGATRRSDVPTTQSGTTETNPTNGATRRRTPGYTPSVDNNTTRPNGTRTRDITPTNPGTETHGDMGNPANPTNSMRTRPSSSEAARRAREALSGRTSTDRTVTTPEDRTGTPSRQQRPAPNTNGNLARDYRTGTTRTSPQSPTTETRGTRGERPTQPVTTPNGTSEDRTTRPGSRARTLPGETPAYGTETRRVPTSDRSYDRRETTMPSTPSSPARRDRATDTGTRSREIPSGQGSRAAETNSPYRSERRGVPSGGVTPGSSRSAERGGNAAPARDRTAPPTKDSGTKRKP